MIGKPPPACDDFTLALVDERKAALFGGENRSGFLSDLLIVELLSRDTVVSDLFHVQEYTHTHTHTHTHRVTYSLLYKQLYCLVCT